MLKLFGQTDRDFTSNGDKAIDAFRAKVKKVDNGDFYLELETDLSYVNDLTEGRIILAPTPQGEQPFRISNVQKTKNKLTTKCPHVFFDSKNYLIADSYVVEKTANDALDHLNNATEPVSEFTTISDINTVSSFRCVRKSLYEAFTTVQERWGGHFVRDGFTVALRESIGQDNGVVVRYAKNLKEITVDENWDDVVTKILPVGYDGLLLPEQYIESSNQYDIPYTKTISFDQSAIEQESFQDANGVLDQEAYQAALIDDLRQQATSYVMTNSVPQVNYTLKANLEKVTDIGDTVYVIDERLGLTIETNVLSYTYDCILGKYIELEFGNFKNTLSGLVSSISGKVESAVQESTETLQATLSSELTNATNEIWAALGNSYVIYEGDKILVVDSLPKETATNVIMINNGGIAFSQTGINGTFNSAWTIDGTLNMQAINVINLTADLIKGGTLKLGSNLNQSGTLEVYDEANNLVAQLNNDGFRVFLPDGSYVLMNPTVGFAGYDRNDNKIFWADYDEFHMKKSVVEEEITLCNKVRWIPMAVYAATEAGEIDTDAVFANTGGYQYGLQWNVVSRDATALTTTIAWSLVRLANSGSPFAAPTVSAESITVDGVVISSQTYSTPTSDMTVATGLYTHNDSQGGSGSLSVSISLTASQNSVTEQATGSGTISLSAYTLENDGIGLVSVLSN